MNCFVIMPFAEEFDDVYVAIKQAVESATSGNNSRCFRLDESRPAGRITDRLLGELRSATFCVADITGARPNIMWELGYAMALGTPAIVVTQDLAELPFDIRDMQTIEYQRHRLTTTLSTPLKRVVIDTLANSRTTASLQPSQQQAETIGTLLNEVGELKKIISEVVGAWKRPDGGPGNGGSLSDLHSMVGHWLNTESGSHLYSRVVRGELVVPYCYMGNDGLTGFYFAWRRTGDYWFARYRWLASGFAGFSFLKHESNNALIGAWWSSEDEVGKSESPPKFEGVPARWVHLNDDECPEWAEAAFREVELEGLAGFFARNDAERDGVGEKEED